MHYFDFTALYSIVLRVLLAFSRFLRERTRGISQARQAAQIFCKQLLAPHQAQVCLVPAGVCQVREHVVSSNPKDSFSLETVWPPGLARAI